MSDTEKRRLIRFKHRRIRSPKVGSVSSKLRDNIIRKYTWKALVQREVRYLDQHETALVGEMAAIAALGVAAKTAYDGKRKNWLDDLDRGKCPWCRAPVQIVRRATRQDRRLAWYCSEFPDEHNYRFFRKFLIS